MSQTYRHFFDIDPEYFPQVNEQEMREHPDLWKKFYPHATFVKLIKDTISVLSRKNKLSIWVEGAYGTGKSHAVLTLKHLLDAPNDEMKEYFDRFPQLLSTDIYNQLLQLKGDGRQILTVHRYGSSSIRGDADLAFAIQDSIRQALDESGYSYKGDEALKAGTIEWLSQPWAQDAFNALITDRYAQEFGGDDVKAIITHLREYTGDALIELMRKISKVGNENKFNALYLDVKGLIAWIKDIIAGNKLKAVVFIWDEFTDYFRNNSRSLTGFQETAEVSATSPFYLMIVTHMSTALFDANDKDQRRVIDRFITPTCKIEMPENMAFKLMGTAMVLNEDAVVRKDWNVIVDDLASLTHDSRERVEKQAHIEDADLNAILPIHPYAALLLKHISSAFDSNQRSMFDFIKNDRGEEIKGFQWYIDHCGVDDVNPLLTVDMLWDFFYEKGKEYLAPDVRATLDCFDRATTQKLTANEARVLKAVLMMQAISTRSGDAVEILQPTEQNLNLAFEGSDLNGHEPSHIADKLCKDQILYHKPMGGEKYQYAALVGAGDMDTIRKISDKIRTTRTTAQLIEEADFEEKLTPSDAMNLRYKFMYATSANIRNVANNIRNIQDSKEGILYVVIALAKNDEESAAISKAIEERAKDPSYRIIFVDASVTPLGTDKFDQYVVASSNAEYQQHKDNQLAAKYLDNAKDVLHKWREAVVDGEFLISYLKRDGSLQIRNRVITVDNLFVELRAIDREFFANGLEQGGSVVGTMWTSTTLKNGVQQGIEQTTKGTFSSSNPLTKLENFIGPDAWHQAPGVKPYWLAKPNLLISKVKIEVDRVIADGFNSPSKRIAVMDIYDDLAKPPIGILPCNLTAFVLGFVLKEYVDSGYSCSDGINSEPLTVDRLKEVVSEAISQHISPNPRYRDKYIVMFSDEEKSFNDSSARLFKIPISQCSSVEQTRDLGYYS